MRGSWECYYGALVIGNRQRRHPDPDLHPIRSFDGHRIFFSLLAMQKNKAQFFDNMSTQAQKENSSSDAAAVAKPTKPTRPLTAYHLFFQLEREFMLPLASSGIDFIYY